MYWKYSIVVPRQKKFISIFMYLAPFFVSDIVLLMCILVSRMLMADELVSFG